MADREYMTSQTYSATLGGIVYNVSVNRAAVNFIADGDYNVKAYGAIGNGVVDDTASIQAAIDAAEAAGGGRVFFPSGTYNVATGMAIDNDNINIAGAGIGATTVGWQGGDGAGGDGANGSYIFTVTDADSISFNGMSLTNGPSEDIGATNNPNAGGIITATGSTKLRIDDCYLYEIGGSYGFVIRKCSDVKVTNTTFYMISYAGMMVLDTCFDINVTGCTFDTTNSSDVGFNRYLFATGATTLLSADATNAYFLKDLLVSGNTFKNNAVWEGIDSHGGDRITITNNTVTGCYIGINAINATSSGDAYVTDASMDDLIISENTIEADGVSDGWFGIVVRGHNAVATTEPWFCENSKIINNTIRGYGGPDKTFSGAITVYRARNVEISGNHIDDFAQTAVMLYTRLSGVRVVNNVFYNAGTTHQYSDRVAGVTVRDATGMDDIIIDGNRCFDDTGNWDYGLYGWAGTAGAGVGLGSNEYIDATSAWTSKLNSVAAMWTKAAGGITSSWPMGTSSAAGETFTGGYYLNSGTANDFTGAQTFGSVNGSYAAHFYVVLGATAVDEITITVTGTTITDAGAHLTGQNKTIVIPDASVANTYFETTEKWLGQVSVVVTGGTPKTCDFGFCKYWDNANTDFTLDAVEVMWDAAKTDAGFDIDVHCHKATGWTYTGTGATAPVLTKMSTVHSTERSCIAGHPGAFKITGLNTDIAGGGSEGLIFNVTTTTTNVLNYGSVQIWYTAG